MPRILIAEDDDSMRSFLARALERAGYEVESASDGIEAAAAISERGFDLLIADIVMPGLDGVELARRACLERPELRVMFITGFAAVALQARETAPKESRILSKPFHLRELVEQVRDILAA
ncbi:MAG: response regulator [Alphaproteobacteria bacterium]|nr:response regulator [Alphaproteobacteria bacterium]